MKRFFKILFLVLIILIVAAAGLVYFNKDLILPVFRDPEQLITQEIQSGEGLREKLNEYLSEPVREFTDEEKQLIDDHKITYNEVLAKVLGERAASKTDIETSSAEDIISRYSATLYEMQGRYTAEIEAVIVEAKSDYLAQRHSGVAASTAQANTLSKYSGKLYSLQSACDAEFETQVTSLSSELKAINADTSIVASMREAYNQAKSSKISYYANLYQ